MRLLVVEDEPDLRCGVCQFLREEGYAVDEAADGIEGLEKALAWEYDAIVLDWMLPCRSGLELLAGLRAERSTPVLFLTARDGINDRVTGLDRGADDYLIKPFQLAELAARVRALIRRCSGATTAVLSVGDITLDTASRRVFLRGQPVTLAAREIALLELLMLHRGRLVTRTLIYDHLFDETHDSLSNLVDVYISRLRAKLGSGFVSTRRGEGYIVDV